MSLTPKVALSGAAEEVEHDPGLSRRASKHFNAGNMVLADGSAHQFTQTGLAR